MNAPQSHHYAIENENNYVLVLQGKYSKNEFYSKTKNLQVLAHKSLVCFGLIILHGMIFTHHTSVARDLSHPYICRTKFGVLALKAASKNAISNYPCKPLSAVPFGKLATVDNTLI